MGGLACAVVVVIVVSVAFVVVVVMITGLVTLAASFAKIVVDYKVSVGGAAAIVIVVARLLSCWLLAVTTTGWGCYDCGGWDGCGRLPPTTTFKVG